MADLSIDTSDITAALRKNLEGFSPDVEVTQVGRVLEVDQHVGARWVDPQRLLQHLERARGVAELLAADLRHLPRELMPG